jgi:hypothetical protein
MYNFTATPLILQTFTTIYPINLNSDLASSFWVDVAITGQKIFLLQSLVWYQFTINQNSGSVMNVIQNTIENPATSLAVIENGFFINLVITQI